MAIRRLVFYSWALTFFDVALIATLIDFTGIGGTGTSVTAVTTALAVTCAIAALVLLLLGRRPLA